MLYTVCMMEVLVLYSVIEYVQFPHREVALLCLYIQTDRVYIFINTVGWKDCSGCGMATRDQEADPGLW